MIPPLLTQIPTLLCTASEAVGSVIVLVLITPLTAMVSVLFSQTGRPEAFPHPQRSQAESTRLGSNRNFSQVQRH